VSAKTVLLCTVLLGGVSGCVGEKPIPQSAEGGSEIETHSTDIQPDPAAENVPADQSSQPAQKPAELIDLDQAVGDLLTTLGSGETQERIAASRALSERSAEVVSQHADWMKAGSVSQRHGIMLMMTGKAQVFPDETYSLVKLALVDGDSKVRRIGVQLIRQLLPVQTAELHTQLLEMTKDRLEDSAIRNAVLRMITLIPGDALATETVLGEIIMSAEDDSTVKQAALQSYVKIAPAAPAIATLISVLEKSDSSQVKRTTAVLLGKYGTKSKASVELLGGLMENDEEDLQEAAAEALARIGSPSIDVLVKKLDSDNLLTRQMAIFTLGVIGPSAGEHVQRLQEFITEDDSDTSLIAKEAIFNILKTRQ